LERPVQEAFVSATVKDSRTDIFTVNSGTKVGSFSLDSPIPWLTTIIVLDEKGKPMQKRDPSPFLSPSKDNHSLIYRGSSYQKEIDPENTENPSVFDVVWNCPDPEFGTIVMIVNFRFVGSKEWYQLRYSLKESAVRSALLFLISLAFFNPYFLL
jgi:hypothetical protein